VKKVFPAQAVLFPCIASAAGGGVRKTNRLPVLPLALEVERLLCFVILLSCGGSYFGC